jgi:RNA polymerase sigma factor FliA
MTVGMRSQTVRDTDANELVHSHLPLVGHLYAQLAGRLPSDVSAEDLLAAGLLGLVDAAQRSVRSPGKDFTATASASIRAAVLDELRQVPWSSRRLPATGPAIAATAARLGPHARTTDIAYEMGVDRDVLRRMVAQAQPAAGLDDSSTLNAPDGQTPSHGDALAVLPAPLRRVLIALFFHGRTVDDVASQLGISTDEVVAMRSKGLALLRGGETHREAVASADRPSRPPVAPAQYAAIASASAARAAVDSAAGDVAERIALSALAG